MRRYLISSCVIAMLLGGSASLTAQSPDLFANWFSDASGYTQAMREHDRLKKPLLIYFYTDWCPYCRRLNTQVMGSAAVQKYLGSLVKVRINSERGVQEKELANRYHIRGYPALFLFPANSNRLLALSPYRRSQTGWVLMTPDEFIRKCQALAGRDA